MKSSYLKIAFLFAAGAGLALSCAQSETTDIHTGPTTGTGGTTATGGSSATGGSTGTGGNSATGGSTGTGGNSATGGSTGTGGNSATGGSTGTGGVLGTGGSTGGSSGTAGRSGGTGGSSGTAGRSGGTGGSGGGSGTATFADVTALFAANCVACHDGSAHTDLRSSGLYARIVNQNATKSCTTQKLIVPNSPSTSLISNKIKGTNLGGCGARMPYQCSTTSSNPRACLTTAQIATVDNWINAGAPM